MSWIGTLKTTVTRNPKNLTPGERQRMAKDLIQMSALGAATVTYAPLPVIDFVAITPIQAAMVMAVGRVYGRKLSMEESRHVLLELASVCGAGLLARQLWTTASKLLLPGLGGILAGPYTFAVTWAMGRTAQKYFEDPEGRRDRLKQAFKDALEEGKALFSMKKLEEFRKKYGTKVRDFVGGVGARARGKTEPASRRPPRRKATRKPHRRSTR